MRRNLFVSLILLAALFIALTPSVASADTAPTGIIFENTGESLTIYTGKTSTLTPRLVPAGAVSVLSIWYSSNESVATVADGVITGHNKGTATITYEVDGGITKSIAVTVLGRVNSISLSVPSLTLGFGQSYQVGTTLLPADCTEPLTWSIYPASSKVATVNEYGLITAGKVAGKAYVICTTLNGRTARLKLTVVNSNRAVQSMKISVASAQVAPGATIRLAAKAYPAAAQDRQIRWSSSDTSIATVSADGIVTGVNNGTVTITATASSGITKKCTVRVQEIEVSSITYKRSSATMRVGQSGKLAPTIMPGNAVNKTLTWTCEDPSVVSVDATGRITALKEGSVLITATAVNGVKGTFTINVINNPVTQVKLSRSKAYMTAGTSGSILVGVGPSNATDKTVVWSSSHPTIATVDSNGTIKAVSAGKTIITAASKTNPKVKATCEIVVYPNTYQRAASTYVYGKASAWVASVRYNTVGNLVVRVCYYNSKSRPLTTQDFGDEIALYTSNTVILKSLPIGSAEVKIVPARKAVYLDYVFNIYAFPEMANQNLRKLNANSRVK